MLDICEGNLFEWSYRFGPTRALPRLKHLTGATQAARNTVHGVKSGNLISRLQPVWKLKNLDRKREAPGANRGLQGGGQAGALHCHLRGLATCTVGRPQHSTTRTCLLPPKILKIWKHNLVGSITKFYGLDKLQTLRIWSSHDRTPLTQPDTLGTVLAISYLSVLS